MSHLFRRSSHLWGEEEGGQKNKRGTFCVYSRSRSLSALIGATLRALLLAREWSKWGGDKKGPFLLPFSFFLYRAKVESSQFVKEKGGQWGPPFFAAFLHGKSHCQKRCVLLGTNIVFKKPSGTF